MKQKYLLISAAIILFILIIVTSLVGNLSKKTQLSTIFQLPTPSISKNNPNNQVPTPTLSTAQKNYATFQNLVGLLGPSQNSVSTSPSTINIPTSIPLTTEQKSQQNYKAFNDLLGIMFGQGTNKGGQQQSSFYPSSSNIPTSSPSLSSNQPRSLVYYPQCNGPYDNDPMPNGCNFCAAGCGPASVAMILSSYIDKKFDPSTVLDLYKQSGLTAGCQGTTIVAAQQILNQNGMKTTDIIYYEDSSFDEVVFDMKQYINNGWTLFTLVKYGPDWGHFYWVVDVDENSIIWAYDPGDAKRPVPLNENSVKPTAKYMLAIGVKK